MTASAIHASISTGTAIVGDQDAVHSEGESHRSTAAPVVGVARNLLARLGSAAVPARPSMFIGYVRSGGDSEYVGRYYDCAKSQYAEDDEYHIHDNKRLMGQNFRKCK